MDQTGFKPSPDRSDGPATARPLGRDNWIEQGLELLVQDGIDAVRITRLAEALDVTRGSFYWHFKDRDDLLEALIDRWESRNSRAVIAAVGDHDDLTSGILALFDVWLDTSRFYPRLDSAVRDWARRSDTVRRAVEQADQGRIEAIAALFKRAGFGDLEAFIRARILYFTQVGYYALGIEETLVQRFSYLEPYFEGFTGRQLDPAAAKAYRAKFLDRRNQSSKPIRGS